MQRKCYFSRKIAKIKKKCLVIQKKAVSLHWIQIEYHGPGRFPVKNKEMNFEYFKIVCEELAKSIGCTFKFNNYPEFGWFGGSFEVDAFGGIAAIVKFYNGVWSNNDFAFGSLSEALANVPEQVKEMAAARADVDFFQNYD